MDQGSSQLGTPLYSGLLISLGMPSILISDLFLADLNWVGLFLDRSPGTRDIRNGRGSVSRTGSQQEKSEDIVDESELGEGETNSSDDSKLDKG